MNSKLHAICDGQGRPVVMMLSEGQMNDQKGAGLLAPLLPPARELIADRGYDSNGWTGGRRRRKAEYTDCGRHASYVAGW